MEREVTRMPSEDVLERAHEDAQEGKSPSTQAGEFVREEIEHVREGKHGARSTKQAIAIGLSKARRAGIRLKPPQASRTSPATRRKAKRDSAKAQTRSKPSPKRSRAVKRALKREGKSAASRRALSRQARSAARTRTRKERSQAAKAGAKTRAAGRRSRRKR
jgi:hypothetical protein